MKIYLASWYQDKPRMRGVATMLQNMRCTVVSSWVFSPGEVYPLDPETNAYWAMRNGNEVHACDVFVGFEDAEVFRKGQGGRHTEFGIALATEKTIVMVGEPAQGFHHLPGLVWVKNVAELRQYLEDLMYMEWFER